MENLTRSVLIRNGKIIGAVGDKIYTSTPIGTILPFAGTSIPNGFLVCDGRSVNAEQYPELYGIIGTAYGGDEINFNLPTITSDNESVTSIIKAYHTNEGADTGVSDDIINYINSSYASKETPISQAEYDALDEQTKLENDYRCYDTGRLYYKGILYGGGETKEITYEEYKTMKKNGELDENTEYLVVVDENDILLMGNDIGYSNSVSGIEATTVQEAIDEVNDKVENMIDDESVDENTVLSSKKTTEELAKKENVYTTDSIANTLYYACEYFGLDCRNQYQVLEIEVIDVKGQNLKFNSIYKHEVLHHAQVISENGITLKAIDNIGTLAFENTSDYTVKVKHIDICPDSIGDTLVTVINRANKNALVSEVLKNITVSTTLLFSEHYANIYPSLFGLSKFSEGSIIQITTDSYQDYVFVQVINEDTSVLRAWYAKDTVSPMLLVKEKNIDATLTYIGK